MADKRQGKFVRSLAEMPLLRGAVTRRLVATGADTDGTYTIIETTATVANSGPPVHIHHAESEAFLVLDGEYRVFIDGREHRGEMGSFIFIPAGVPHTFRAASVGSRKLNIYAPSGMEGYFEDLHGAVQAGMSPSDLAKIAERYSMEIVGPIADDYVTRDSGDT